MPRPLAPLLLPISMLYGGLAAARRALFRRGFLRVERLSVPVISVGGLAFGGSGKTPVAREIAIRLLRRGLRVAVISGAYGARVAGSRVVHLGGGEDATASDEARLLARWLPEVEVYCARDKARAARTAVTDGAEVILLDDGFQHLKLHRDLDVLLQAERVAWPPPLGDSRELAAAARFADLRWAHGRSGVAPASGAEILSKNVVAGLSARGGELVLPVEALASRRVFLLAAVARPNAFVALVRAQGADIVGFSFARDHQILSAQDLRAAERADAELIVCTEKDAARSGQRLPAHALALACEVKITRGERLIEVQIERISRLVRSSRR